MSRESIGQQLTRYREAAGLTTASAAARLHCDESILISLEADQFAQIGARVFVQGHLRRYAELLGAPTAELMAEWSAEGSRLGTPDLTQIPRMPVRTVDSQVWGRRLGVLAAAVVIGVAAWWILQGAGVATTSSVAPTESTAAVATSAVAAPVAATPAAATTAVATTVVVTPSAAAPGRVSVAIRVRADCWVEIYDAAGQKLYFDNVRGGSLARAAGEGPLRILLGRADVASLEVAGRVVTIPAGFVRNATAYFTVDSAATLREYLKPEAPTGAAP